MPTFHIERSDKRPLTGAIALVASIALALVACSHQDAPAAAVPHVGVSTPFSRKVTDWDSFTGRFEAIDSVDVKARVTGRIDDVLFRDGDMVAKDQLLFRLDQRPFRASVVEATGRLASAQAQSVLAKQELHRAKTLLATDTIATSVFQQRTQAAASAQAGIEVAEGVLERAKLDLEFSEVRAPMAGRISRKLVSTGDLVNGGDSAGTMLTTVVTLDPIYIYFDIDEASYLKYMRFWKAGTRAYSREQPNPVRIALTDEDKPSRSGDVDFLENRLDKSTGTLRARAKVSNTDLFLSPGQFGRVQLIGSAPHITMLVPDTAVSSDATRRVVSIVDAKGVVALKPVVLGELFGTYREIWSGLLVTDRVVVDGLQRAQPGSVVVADAVKLPAPDDALLGTGR